VVGRELRRVGEKLCAWVRGMLFGIRRTRTRPVEKGQGRKEEGKERLRVDVCLIRTVCRDVYGLAENPARVSCEGGFV
jgi:hypothetical protein